MAVADVLETRFTADASGYVRGSNQAISATQRFGGAISGIALPGLATMVTALGAVASAYVAVGVSAMRQSAGFDSLVKSLESIEGSADAAKRALAELQDIAKLPGLGLQEAVKGYNNLRRNGMDQDQSFRLLRAAGSANDLAGGGREQLSRILLAFTQIQTNGQIAGDELNQLAEAGIAAKKMLKDRFGTSDGGELAKMGVDSEVAIAALVEEMEKLPKGAKKFTTVLENLAMAGEMAAVGLGDGLNNALMPHLEALGSTIESLTENGALEALGSVIGDLVLSVMPDLKDGTNELYGQFIELGAVIADTVQGMINLGKGFAAMGDMFGQFMDSPFNPVNAINPDYHVRAVFGDRYAEENKAGMDGPGAGDEFKRRALRGRGQYGPQLSEADELARKANEKATKDAEKIDDAAKTLEQNRHLSGIERNTKIMADEMRNVFGTSQLGGNTVNAVNVGRINGSSRAAQVDQMFGLVQMAAVASQTSMIRRR